MDHLIGLGAGAGVVFDGFQESTVGGGGTAVMHEENSLADSPERSRSELIGARIPLWDAIVQSRAHVVEQQIGEQVRLHVSLGR